MPMPFGTSKVKWPGQPPNGVMNTYNETSMTETMGQMSSLAFAFSAPAKFTFYVEVADTSGNLADSPSIAWNGTNLAEPGLPKGWMWLSFPFGPDSNYSLAKGSYFDWSSVSQIRYVLPNPPAPISMFFDGFAIVKPLVVQVFQSGATTRRTQTYVQSGILTYKDAANYGNAQLQYYGQPQQYYKITNIGRNDLPAGNYFTAFGKTLVAREVDYSYNKSQDGWLIDVEGYEPT
jgi:hypothetical protein